MLGKNKSLSEADSPSRQISVRADVSSDVATSRTRRDKPRGNMSLKWRTVYRRTVNEGLKLPLVVGRRNETVRGIMELDYGRKASTPRHSDVLEELEKNGTRKEPFPRPITTHMAETLKARSAETCTRQVFAVFVSERSEKRCLRNFCFGLIFLCVVLNILSV